MQSVGEKGGGRQLGSQADATCGYQIFASVKQLVQFECTSNCVPSSTSNRDTRKPAVRPLRTGRCPVGHYLASCTLCSTLSGILDPHTREQALKPVQL
jgi:hypothetical protein